MKTFLSLVSVLCLVEFPLQAQVTKVVVQPGEVTPPATARLLDPLAAQRQLLIAPKIEEVVVTTPASLPGQVVKTTTTTTTVETPGRPARVYQTERNVVTVRDQNQYWELPYVTLPVLFVRETAELLDAESRSNLEQMASVINTVCAAEPDALFDIEGHTSTEGAPEINATLSLARARRVFDELTMRYGVSASVLHVHGYGASYALHPQGTEAEMQMDRRVLIVRTK
jgi:outer membrane protein OmpA-like peptidoglycan-associated protein